jgi:hypothetical protein
MLCGAKLINKKKCKRVVLNKKRCWQHRQRKSVSKKSRSRQIGGAFPDKISCSKSPDPNDKDTLNCLVDDTTKFCNIPKQAPPQPLEFYKCDNNLSCSRDKPAIQPKNFYYCDKETGLPLCPPERKTDKSHFNLTIMMNIDQFNTVYKNRDTIYTLINKHLQIPSQDNFTKLKDTNIPHISLSYLISSKDKKTGGFDANTIRDIICECFTELFNEYKSNILTLTPNKIRKIGKPPKNTLLVLEFYIPKWWNAFFLKLASKLKESLQNCDLCDSFGNFAPHYSLGYINYTNNNDKALLKITENMQFPKLEIYKNVIDKLSNPKITSFIKIGVTQIT